MDVLTADVFIDLVHNVADSEKRASLECLTSSFLGAWAAGGDEAQTFFKDNSIGIHLRDSYQTFLKFCKCIAHLLQVAPPRLALSSLDVTEVTAKKSPDTFLRMVKTLLTSPEPDSDACSAVKADSRAFWMEEVSDVVKTAATDHPFRKECQGYTAELKQAIAQHETSPVLVPGVAEKLQVILEALPKMSKGMRKGGCSDLETLVKDRLRQLASALLNGVEPNISSSDLNILLNGLKRAQMSDIQLALVDWATKHNATIAAADFEALCDKYLEKVSGQSYTEVIPVEVETWKAVLGKATIPPTALPKLHKVLAHMLSRTALQAGGHWH